MKSSISSTVRGTHVSSSIPVAVTVMSSSIRTCTGNTWLPRHSRWGWEARQAATAARAQGAGETQADHHTANMELLVTTSTLAWGSVGSNFPWATGPCHPPGITQASWWPLVWWWPLRCLRCLCCIGYIKDSLSKVLQQWVHAMSFHGASKSQPPWQQKQWKEHSSLDMPPAFLAHGLLGTVPPDGHSVHKAVLLLSCNSGSYSALKTFL